MIIPLTVRPPWNDELLRIAGLLPRNARALAYRVAVIGRVERIAAAAVLYQLEDEPTARRAYLRFTGAAAVEAGTMVELVQSLTEHARASDMIDELLVVSAVEVTQPLYEMLVAARFEPHRHLEIYRLEIGALRTRLKSLFQRMAARGLIPATARVTSPHGDWVPRLRAFLESEKPGLSERLDTEVEGFALEHTLLLVMHDQVKGVLFTRNRGAESFIGLILVARELRGGAAWANAFLLREVLLDGIASGVEHVVFETHRDDHRGTLHLARASGAQKILERAQFRANLAHLGDYRR
jgi:hypothetical protein